MSFITHSQIDHAFNSSDISSIDPEGNSVVIILSSFSSPRNSVFHQCCKRCFPDVFKTCFRSQPRQAFSYIDYREELKEDQYDLIRSRFLAHRPISWRLKSSGQGPAKIITRNVRPQMAVRYLQDRIATSRSRIW